MQTLLQVQQGAELIPLQVKHGAVGSCDGTFRVLRDLPQCVTPAPVQSSMDCILEPLSAGQSRPPSVNEACKGVLLSLSNHAASSEAAVDVGEVCGAAFLAAARIKLCWMAPTHSSTISGLPRHMQFLLVELSTGGPYAIILPLLPNSFKATLQPAGQQPPSGNGLAVHLDSGNPDFKRSSWQAAVYVAAGHDPFHLCDVAVAAAAAIAGCAHPRWDKVVPDISRYLGWCTWDAFYTDVSAAGVMEGLQAFKQAGIQPRWLIIDDGWQRTGLDSTAHTLQQQQRQRPQGSSLTGRQQQQHHPLQLLGRSLSLLRKRLLRALFGWVHWRGSWCLLLVALRQPWTAGITSQLLQAYNRATSEHSKRLLSAYQFNAKFSGLAAGPAADTSTASTSAQVLAFVQHIKQQHGIQHVIAWHATLGYWSGTSPAAAALDAAAAEGQPGVLPSSQTSDQGTHTAHAAAAAGVVLPRVTPIMSDLEPPTNWSQLVLGGVGVPADPQQFYGLLHSRLAACGISGVKVDVQNQLELVGTAAGQQGGQVLAQAWHKALEDSVASHFPGNMLINCMCHNTSDLYRMRDSYLARVSDDFYPHLPASHTTHVAVCAFNSMFCAPLVQPDWDMFHSEHPRALLHATARMISGGPVYVSDRPGRTNATLLSRLALPGGRLLQPLLPGRPTRDCLFADVCGDGVSALKVWSINPCGGVLALFNVQGSNWSRSRFNFVTFNHHPPAVTATACPDDVAALGSTLQRPEATATQGTVTADTTSAQLCTAVQGMAVEHTAGQSGPSTAATGPPAAAAAAAAAGMHGIQLGPGLHHTGGYVLFSDHTAQMRVVQGLADGLTMTLNPAECDVVTVSPLLQLSASSESSSTGSSRGSDGSDGCGAGGGMVLCAVVGLVNMLNPGGAVQAVHAGAGLQTLQGQQRAPGSSDGSNNGSNGGCDSGSWVLAGGAAGAESSSTAAAGTSDTAAAAGVWSQGPVLIVQLLGAGELLLHSSRQPEQMLLDGVPVGFSYEGRSCRCVVVVPLGRESSLQHTLMVRWA